MDDKAKKQLMVIGALIPVLLLAVIYALWGCGVFSGHKAPPPAPSAPAAYAPAAPAPPQPPSPAVAKQRQEAVTSLEDGSWVRNPFKLGVVARAPVIYAPGRTVLPDMKLEGIVWDKKSPYAIIDGELRTIGDVVSGFVVQNIKQDRVILEKNGDVFELGLFPELTQN